MSLQETTSQSRSLEAVVKITSRSWDPAAAGRRAVEKHGGALRRLADGPEDAER